MRHGDKINNLSRTKSHRMALLSGLACQLIEHKKIVTTLAKAKALRIYVEPLITKSKENTTHQRRLVFGSLNDKKAVTELFTTVSPKVGGRPGGYTRIIKLGKRVGDNAELAMIELVDFNEIYGKGIGEEAKTTRRTRRGGRGKKSEATEEAATKTEETASPKAQKAAPKAENAAEAPAAKAEKASEAPAAEDTKSDDTPTAEATDKE